MRFEETRHALRDGARLRTVKAMSLKERREIVTLAGEGLEGVLVTLVRAAGSTYRRPGARLLALPDGRTAGTISGGCLEADLLRKAQWRVREGAVLQSYDTGFDDVAEIPFGLGCGGAVDLLLEPAGSPEARATLDALRATLDGEARRVITQLPSAGKAMARMVLDEDGDVLFASEHLSTEEIVPLRRRALDGESEDREVFAEVIAPAQRLIVLGAGEDVKPLTRVAAELGWTVIVADGRPQQARAERFPQAHRVLVASSARQAGVAASDAVVLMTHSFEQDRLLLTELLAIRPRYLGLLGARHRSALLMRQACEESGMDFAEAIARVHAPIGLDLGGDGPESIALAIASEVQMVLQGKPEFAGRSRGMSVAEAEIALSRFAQMPTVASACALETPEMTVADEAALDGGGRWVAGAAAAVSA